MPLTDEQYLQVLKSARAVLDRITEAHAFDDTTIGHKVTESNVGLCNDGLTTKETAKWPDEFPSRRSMKSLQAHHKCPLDKRTEGDFAWGCFYHCRVFQDGLSDIEEMKVLYDEAIASFEKGMGKR